MWAMVMKEFQELRRDKRTMAMLIVLPLVGELPARQPRPRLLQPNAAALRECPVVDALGAKMTPLSVIASLRCLRGSVERLRAALAEPAAA